jgi:hypothetical protein
MKHTHKFRRSIIGEKYQVLKCQSCPSYYADEQSIGISSLCNFCETPFLMTKALLYNSKGDLKKIPHCGCKNKKYLSKKVIIIKQEVKENKFKTLDDILSEIKR